MHLNAQYQNRYGGDQEGNQDHRSDRTGCGKTVNRDAKDKDAVALIQYIADEDKLEKLLETQQIIKTPVVRNGKQSTLGYQPDVWKKWE